jgi:Putative transposase/Transposase zinc-binding domain
MQCSMQEVFAKHFDAFAQGRRLHLRELSAAHSIRTCYTAERGGHLDYCAQGHLQREVFYACRHRSCPRCAKRPRQAWVQAELDRLLACPHFHVVFTLPHELLGLWEFNRQAFSDLLFDCVRLSLLQLLGDPRHLGATPGLLLSQHTWGRTLSHHPHIHALVSAGGLNAKAQWCATREGFLLPLKPLRKLFSGKLLARLREVLPTWSLPPQQTLEHWLGVIKSLYRKHWNIQISAPYSHGRGVALYLARYAKGGPLPADRALQLKHSQVSFGYTDHRDARAKALRLPANEFIARVLWHAPPKGSHTVRHAGLYASAGARKRGAAALALACAQLTGAAQWPLAARPLAATAPQRPPDRPPTPVLPPPPNLCPSCSKPLLRLRLRALSRAGNQISPLAEHSTKALASTTEAPGPTIRSSRHSTAGSTATHRRRRLRPLNAA